MSAAGALIGLSAALGVLLIVQRLPSTRRPSLEDRLGPYLRDTPRPSSLLDVGRRTLTPFPTLERLFAPSLSSLAGRIDVLLGGSSTIRRRLDQSGSRRTLEQFRTEQVLSGAAGIGLGVLLLMAHAAFGLGPSAGAGLVLTLAFGIVGVLGRDYWLGRAVDTRSAAIALELPTVAELLALAVAAGEGPVGALERVVSLSGGELAGELGRALADARSGSTLLVALQGVATRTAVPAVARFTDGLSVAIERGTPLSEVLRAQAVDAREAGRRALLQAGGKKEIAMLVTDVHKTALTQWSPDAYS